jgi:aspartate kinase
VSATGIKVLKFGGSSVQDAAALRRAASLIVQEIPAGGLVVVSALKGVSDTIIEALAAATRNDLAEARDQLDSLRSRHLTVAQELGLLGLITPLWSPLLERLSDQLEGAALVGEASLRTRDAALTVGETLSAQLLAQLLAAEGRPARFRDAREVLLTDQRHGQARPDLAGIKTQAAPWFVAIRRGAILVTQGFVGQGPEGSATTLGRGGSDTSAALFGEALGADEVQIWTDVDGILTADPSLVPEARPIPRMSLAEAAALSAFGAKVLHPDCLAPAARGGFSLLVANTLRPNASRTAIHHGRSDRKLGEVSSVAYKEGLVTVRFPPAFPLDDLVALALRLEEAGSRRYGLLNNPEGSLLVLRPETTAAEAILDELSSTSFLLESGWALVALVGDGLREDPGGAARLLAPLAGERLGAVLTGSQGASVAFLVSESRLPDLIPLLHQRFVLEAAGASRIAS